MNDTGIRPEVIEEIRNLAQKYDIEKVILFGSRARGDFRRTSDIDIAVTGGDFARFALDVDEETSTLLEYDIVNLDRDMQDELRESIEKEGFCMRKYENNRKIALGIIADAKEAFYQMFCELKTEIEENWL